MKSTLPIRPMFFNVPPQFAKIANIVPLCDLRPNEKCLFEHACKLVITQLYSDAVTPPDMPTNIFLTDKDDISICFDHNQFGSYFVGIFYPLHKWRAANLTDRQITTCMVEEMCHVFWRIRDEYQVNFKVLDVMRIDHPELTLETLYPYTRGR